MDYNTLNSFIWTTSPTIPLCVYTGGGGVTVRLHLPLLLDYNAHDASLLGLQHPDPSFLRSN